MIRKFLSWFRRKKPHSGNTGPEFTISFYGNVVCFLILNSELEGLEFYYKKVNAKSNEQIGMTAVISSFPKNFTQKEINDKEKVQKLLDFIREFCLQTYEVK